MSALSSTNPRLRNTLITIGSILIVAGIAAGTAFMMKQFTPVKIDEKSAANQQEVAKTPQQKADELFEKGEYTAAKTQYEIALKEYESRNNAAAAGDVKMQLQIIEATTAKSEQAPQNTDRSKIKVGSSQQ